MKKILYYLVIGLMLCAPAFANAESVKQRTNALSSSSDSREMQQLLEAFRTTINNMITLDTELRTDHATQKTFNDAVEALIEELHDDHATSKTALDATETLIEELHDDHATNIAAITAANTALTALAGDNVITSTTLSVGSTPENVASTAFTFRINGVAEAKAAVAAGTAFTAADTINTGAAGGSFWGVWLLQVTTGGTISTKSPAADQVYADEATAIAALPAPDADNASMGYVTIQSNAGATWTAQTDDLTAASDCVASNFYSTTPPGTVTASPAVTLGSAKPASGPATLGSAKPASGPGTITAGAVTTTVTE